MICCDYAGGNFRTQQQPLSDKIKYGVVKVAVIGGLLIAAVPLYIAALTLNTCKKINEAIRGKESDLAKI